MTDAFSPERWAFEITHVLNTVLGAEHFPINVTAVAQEYSVQKFPHDPISRIVGDSLPGFEQGLALPRFHTGGFGAYFVFTDAEGRRGEVAFGVCHGGGGAPGFNVYDCEARVG